MNVNAGIDGLKKLPRGAVLSIGNFDGLHAGHAKILQTMKSVAPPGAKIAILTFEPHPVAVLRPHLVPPRLTTPTMKRELLAAAGVDELIELAPEKSVLDLSAEQFWKLLRDDAQPSHLVEGSTFTFGKNRGGTIEKLRQWTSQSSTQLHVVEPVTVTLPNLHIVQASSTLVRWLINYGRVRDAAVCLERNYSLRGEVIHGFGRGKGLGVATANLKSSDQMIPADGVYAGRAKIDGKIFVAAVSIGTLPTFNEVTRQIEAHLIDFDGDLYGHEIEVELIDWVREQWKFSGVEALKIQIARDVEGIVEIAAQR